MIVNFRGALYVEAGDPLPGKVLRTVDPEIRDIISLINLLPFVVRTRHSCAGYGASITTIYHGPQEEKIVRSLSHSPRGNAYISIQYQPRGWKSFHRGLKGIAKRTEQKEGMPDVWIYDITNLHEPTPLPPSYYKVAWSKVRKLVSKYAKLHGVYPNEKRQAEEKEEEEG